MNRIFLRTLLVAAIILLAIVAFKVVYLKDYDLAKKLGFSRKCYVPQGDDFLRIFSQEGFDYKSLEKQAIENGLQILKDKDLQSVSLIAKIPLITHHIYFSTESKKELGDFYLLKMQANFNKLNSTSNEWKHYIWTNKPDLFPSEVLTMKNVEIKKIEDFTSHTLFDKLSKTLQKGVATTAPAYFAEASDMLRLLALHKYGGIYNDMDYEIYNADELYNYMKKYDFIAGRETLNTQSYFGNSFLVAKPNHPILNEALRRLTRNQNITDKDIPEYLQYACNGYDEIYFNGPPLVTMSYFAKNNQEGNIDIILPSLIIYNVNFARNKNVHCDFKQITREDFSMKNENLTDLIKNFTISESSLSQTNPEISAARQNIYYSYSDGNNYPIVGADMFCGSWVGGGGNEIKTYHYWKFPWSK